MFFKMSDMYGLGPEPELHSFGLVGVSGWGFSLEWWGWGGCCGALTSSFHCRGVEDGVKVSLRLE